MRVLIDTCIWSRALRRREVPVDPITDELSRLLEAREKPAIPSVVRLEVLSGIIPLERLRKVRRDLDAFPTLRDSIDDYDLAAEYYSRCVIAGKSAGHIDVLICAFAVRRKMEIFTTDKDFIGYAGCLPIRIYKRALTFP